MPIATTQKARKWKAMIAKQMGDPDYIQLKRITASIDPNTGAPTGQSETVTSITAILTDYKEGMIDGVNILSGDKQVIASYDCGYQVGDSLVIDGKDYTIVDPKPINPNGSLQVFEMQVRLS